MIENSYNKKLSEITAIDSTDFGYSSEEAVVKTREDLRKIIEEPCLPACLTLYDKNIQTVCSSANKREIGGQAYIGINYDSLDENNKQIFWETQDLYDKHKRYQEKQKVGEAKTQDDIEQ